ncbi:TM220-like protein [Mya arenaria]|uniref:TM220-like protein n=1 Tax=Mya arenaria TaxID=6604 RepID=A0ABY7DCY6_MYAAR|nr:transmembrane protein 220-like [Mya arenaria]XP_052815884.1 transmembrane protein 220-like [Mya arenaria]WAQ95519.1 TM220-like protein [Mya arenaria]
MPEADRGGLKQTFQIMYVWQAVNLVMAMFFSLAALANLNDDDWYLWMPLYVVPALFAVSVVARPQLADNTLWNSGLVVHLTLCCAYALYQVVLLLEALSGNFQQNPLGHEAGREMGGLIIIIAWLVMCRFTSIARPSGSISNRSLMSALLLMSVTLAVLPLFLWSLCFVSDWHTRIAHCSGMFSK